MASRPEMGALLLITHLGGASFDYEDYWNGADLIYTGRGQTGDQSLNGQNGQLARNEATNFVFKYDSPRHLHFLGVARAKQYWWAKGLDRDGVERRIVRFRLSFEEPRGGELQPTAARVDPVRLRRPNLTPRPFDETRPPAPFLQREEREPPEETLARQEKAAHGHHDLLAALNRALIASGWNIIEETRGAIDLWARRPGDGQRVIFEAKTLGDGTEVHQTRSALSQLLEYRHFLGAPNDFLCLVTNAPISDVRERFLRTQGVAVLVHDGATFQAVGPLALEVLGALVQKK
ncbi:hypothetical protein [Corallococcus exiguus]|uniref:hypothetical protein n=1 Tax=Corallococcus exiguus TaxID=83462 RepID=UPI0014709ED4|nr:hypothetical protein [Corallococcus exiguus]NNB86748.1 hypothetical protein [Corallococcus exiguus]